MPLNAIPTYIIPAHAAHVPPVIMVCWAVASICTAVTFFFAIRQLHKDRIASYRLCEREAHVVEPMSVRYVRVIVGAPMGMSFLGLLCFTFPGIGFFVNLMLNIIAAMVLGALVHYYFEALGHGDMLKKILRGFGRRRWHCGSCCGGAFEPLCCLGWIFKEESLLELRNLRIAYKMVLFWIFCFIVAAVFSFNTSQYFLQSLSPPEDGKLYCTSKEPLPALGKALDTISGLSSLVGMAGLTMIASVASMACGEVLVGTRTLHFNAKKKAESATVYLFLLFWEWVLQKVPIEYPTPVVKIPVLTSYHESKAVAGGVPQSDLPFNASGYAVASYTSFDCPVYDKPVCTFLLYCTLITVFMAFTAVKNSQLYPPADVTPRTLRDANMCQAEEEAGLEGDSDEEDSESESEDESRDEQGVC